MSLIISVLTAAAFVSYFLALSYTASAIVSVISTMSQTVTALLAFIFFGEKITPREWVFIVLVGLGIGMMGV